MRWRARYDPCFERYELVRGEAEEVIADPSLDDVADRLNRLEATVAALVKAWPDGLPSSDGYQERQIVHSGDQWFVFGVWQGAGLPTREAAVFAAAGIEPEDQP